MRNIAITTILIMINTHKEAELLFGSFTVSFSCSLKCCSCSVLFVFTEEIPSGADLLLESTIDQRNSLKISKTLFKFRMRMFICVLCRF